MASPLDLRVPFATLIKIALAILLVLCVVKLWPVVLMLVFAVLVAVVLDPLVGWMEAHRVRRSYAIAAVSTVLIALLAVLFIIVLPTISHEMAALAKHWPDIEHRLTASFPPAAQLIASVKGSAQQIHQPQMRIWLTRGLVAGLWMLEGLAVVLFVLVVAIYLLIEGRLALTWLVSFAPPKQRGRLERTAAESAQVILAYVRGNFITSLCCVAYVLAVLLILHVPGVAMLAVIAFVFDYVPVVGTIIQVVPAAALALTVSPSCAGMVVGAYLLYHVIENYFLAPRVYGRQMRLSKLAVLLAFAVGGTLQGVVGAVLALPAAAVWPIIERIWLREKLPEDTVAIHEQLEQEE